jgi:hypothetical protein
MVVCSVETVDCRLETLDWREETAVSCDESDVSRADTSAFRVDTSEFKLETPDWSEVMVVPSTSTLPVKVMEVWLSSRPRPGTTKPARHSRALYIVLRG